MEPDERARVHGAQQIGRHVDDVSATDTASYAAGVLAQGKPFAPRPLGSRMSLAKLEATGFVSQDAHTALDRYLA